MKYIHYIIYTGLILLCACRKTTEEIREKIDDSIPRLSGRDAGVLNWQGLYNMIDSNAIAIFGFSACRSPFVEYQNGAFRGIFRNSATVNIAESYTVSFRQHNVSSNSNKNYTYLNDTAILNLFGDTVSIKGSFKISTTTYPFTYTYKLPEKLELVPDDNFDSLDPEIADGTEITWVEDETDVDSYILIVLDYDPLSLKNEGMSDTLTVERSILTADDGSYSLTETDLEHFTDGAFVLVTVYRFAIKAESYQDTNMKFGLGSMSYVLACGTIKK